jgi:hypothetical protein
MPGVGPAPAAPAPSSASNAPVDDDGLNLPDLEGQEDEVVEPKGKQPAEKPGKQPVKAGTHPWSKDLSEALGSENPEDAVNQLLLRSQQHTTQVEQEAAQYSKMFGGNVEIAQIGAGILMGLEDNPIETLVKVAMGVAVDEDGKPVFDPEELIVALEDMFFPEDGSESGEAPEAQPQRVGQDNPDDAEPPSEEKELLEWARERRQAEQLEQHRETYRTILDNLHEEFKADGQDFDEDRYSKLVVLYNGDLEAAFDDYMENWHQAKPTNGTPAPPNPRTGGSPPREVKQPGSIQEAVDDLFAEEQVRSGRR